MARKKDIKESREGKEQFKFRLIGALVLLAILALVLPAVVDIRSDYDGLFNKSNIPPIPENIRVEILSLEGKTERQLPVERVVEDNGSVDIFLPEAVVDMAVESDLAAEPELVQSKQSPTKAVNAWVVQIGSFRGEANAYSLRDRLRKTGLPAFIDRRRDQDDHYRVRVGPMNTKQEAVRVHKQLAVNMQLDGVVIRHRAVVK